MAEPNLIALCGKPGKITLKLVPMDHKLQTSVSQLFLDQESDFRRSCHEKSFNQNWIIDNDEIATVLEPTNLTIFDSIRRDDVSTMEPILNASKDQIKALAMFFTDESESRILIQGFTKRQLLQRKFALFLDRGSYTGITSNGLILNNKLVCIIEAGVIKFKNLKSLGGFLDTSHYLKEASDSDLTLFVKNALFEEPDESNFCDIADSIIRQKIRNILDRDVLSHVCVSTIQERAKLASVSVEVNHQRIVLPKDRKRLKELVKFLNDERYVGPVSEKSMITNSCRPVEGL